MFLNFLFGFLFRRNIDKRYQTVPTDLDFPGLCKKKHRGKQLAFDAFANREEEGGGGGEKLSWRSDQKAN